MIFIKNTLYFEKYILKLFQNNILYTHMSLRGAENVC